MHYLIIKSCSQISSSHFSIYIIEKECLKRVFALILSVVNDLKYAFWLLFWQFIEKMLLPHCRTGQKFELRMRKPSIFDSIALCQKVVWQCTKKKRKKKLEKES